MGTTESSIVDSARARPGLLLVVLLGGLLLVDLAAKLAGFSILPIGEAISIDRLGSNLWNGVVIGLVIGLAGIGLSMTYSILSFANFSHGDLLSTGAFTGWGVAFLIAGFGDIPVRALLTVGDAGSATPATSGRTSSRRRSRYSSGCSWPLRPPPPSRWRSTARSTSRCGTATGSRSSSRRSALR